MIEELKKSDSNTKTQLSLAAALFFSPLVQHMLNKNTRDITDNERNFIRGYIKFGYITILFGGIVIASGIMNYLFALKMLNVIYTISIFILIFLLLISVVSILSDISLLK
jgi:amino acid transporter